MHEPVPFHNDITGAIGNTPLVKLTRMFPHEGVTVLAKLELCNPCGSIKDRVGHALIEDAERRGLLKPGSVIIEPTSGNTGIALAFICSLKGYTLILTMPESMSRERRGLLSALGAHIVSTPAGEGMRGAVDEAERIARSKPGSFIPLQFSNEANVIAHRRTTGPEIWRDTGGAVDTFIAGVGTGGTVSGVGSFLKEKNPSMNVFAVEPEASAVLSGGKPGPHSIQGIGAGFVPPILKREVIDDIVRVSDKDAREYTAKLARTEGIVAGISSGANMKAVQEIIRRTKMRNRTIVTVICDTGERYLSTNLFE